MKTIITIDPAMFTIPEITDEILQKISSYLGTRVPDDSDILASFFLDNIDINILDGADELALRSVFNLSKKDGKDYLSQRLGPASTWANLLLRLKGESFNIAVLDLRDLGFGSMDTGDVLVGDIVQQAKNLGLTNCSISMVPTFFLSKSSLPPGFRVNIMTDPILSRYGDYKYLSLEGRVDKTYLGDVYANTDIKVSDMSLDTKFGFGHKNVRGNVKFNIPKLPDTYFMYVIPQSCSLFNPSSLSNTDLNGLLAKELNSNLTVTS